MSEELVITPGGVRPKSQVHSIAPGHILKVTDNRIQELDSSGRILNDLGLFIPRPGNQSGREM